MKYDYMNKERPNIYHPSRAGARADASITNASHNQSMGSNDDDETLSNNSNNSNQSSPPPIDNHMDDDHSTLNVNDDSGNGDSGNGDSDDGEQRERVLNLDAARKQTVLQTAMKMQMQMPSIEEQLNTVVRSLNEHQLQAAAQTVNRRPQNALKMYAPSNGLGSIIEKLSVDDSDVNALSSAESQPFKKPQVIVMNSGLDANAKYNVPSSNIVRHEIPDGQAYPKKLMAINARNNIRPEENWRYRSNSNSLESKQPTSKWLVFYPTESVHSKFRNIKNW